MIRKLLSNLYHNVGWLLRHNIREENEKRMVEMLDLFEEYYRYSLTDSKLAPVRPKILDYQETIHLLKERPRSFCRFGDGELAVLEGGCACFQKPDPRLAIYLKQIMKSASSDFYVGLPYGYFHNIDQALPFTRKFLIMGSPRFRKIILEHCNMDATYIDTGFSQKYMNSSGLDFDQYFRETKTLFHDRDLVIFVGKGILDKLSADVFEEARSKEIVEAPTRDAFENFDELLVKARSYPKDKLLCFILGPTSKPLCYELSKDGYLAWDIGHLAQDYNAYCKQVARTPENVIDFFSPD